VVKPLMWISTNVLWKIADVAGIDGAVNGIASGTTPFGDGVRHTQSGNTRSYAVWVVVGALVVIAVVFFWPSVKWFSGWCADAARRHLLSVLIFFPAVGA